MVDNSAYAFGLNIGNGIPIVPFYDNTFDTELIELQSYLKTLVNNNVIDTNLRTFKLDQFHNFKNI